MAARATPSLGKKPDKIWHHAIMRAVKRPTTEELDETAPRLELLADQLVLKGMAGDVAAMREIGDRLDGKPAQSIGLGQADDLKPLETITRPPLTREEWLKAHG